MSQWLLPIIIAYVVHEHGTAGGQIYNNERFIAYQKGRTIIKRTPSRFNRNINALGKPECEDRIQVSI